MNIIDDLKNTVERYKQQHTDFVPFDVITKGIIVSVLNKHFDISEFHLEPRISSEDKIRGFVAIHPKDSENKMIYFEISKTLVCFSDKKDNKCKAYERAMKGII